VLLQGHEILEATAFVREINKEIITKHLHSCKEMLLACEGIAKRVAERIDNIVHDINKRGISKDSQGRALNPFPQVQDLDTDCGMFLIQANRAIKLICELPGYFIELDELDTNFEHLGNRLEKAIGDNVPLTRFVKENAPAVRNLIDLRNFHEHPKKKKTVIQNFQVMPHGEIQVPSWWIVGAADQEAHPIKEEMFSAVDFLMQAAEAMLLHLVIHCMSKEIPFIVEVIPDERVNPENPIKYRMSIDITKLKMAP